MNNENQQPSYAVQIPQKETGTAYLWWFFLGALGAHKFYMGKPGMGFLYAFTLGLVGFGLVYDLFTLPRQVRERNEQLRRQAVEQSGS